MKIKFILFFLLLNANTLCAQNTITDSLLLEIKKAKTSKTKVKLYNEIANAFKTIDGNEVVFYAEKALELSKKDSNKAEEGFSYLNLGNGNIILGNYSNALDYFSKAKTVFELEIKNNETGILKKGLGKSYGSMGVVFSEQSNYTKAFEYYLKSIKIYEELDDKNTLSKLYNNVGVAYRSQDEIKKALEYFSKAQVIQEVLKDVNIGITLTNIANCYFKLKNYPEALRFFNKARTHVQDNKRALGEWNNGIGLYYKVKHQPNMALKYWDSAVKAFKTIDDKFGIADTYLFKSELFLENNNLKEAIENAKQTNELAKQTNVLEQIAASENILAKSYEEKGDLSNALKHFKLYNTAKDSLINTKNIRKGVEAEMNFEYEKKENLKRIEQEKQEILKKEQEKQARTKLVFGALSILFLMGLGFLLYNRSQLKKNLTLQKELTEYEQKALHLQMNPHFIFNCLGAISGFIINNGTDHAIKYLAKFSKLMRLTLEYSKESLIPVEKEIESLQNYLELEKLRFNNTFSFTITKDDAIEDDVAIPPLLIQPLVENAIIHGIISKKEKGNISISFSLKGDSIICVIRDNGIGIDNSIKMKSNSVQIHKSMALDIIKKRLKMITKVTNKKTELISEQINDDSGNSIGTKVLIMLPIQYID